VTGFPSLKRFHEAARDEGKTWISMWRRTAPAMVVGGFTDLSYGGGGPAANYYASAPLVAASLAATDGIYAGPSVSPARKFLRRAWISSGATNSATCFRLLDYVQYVPFLDGDSDAEQTFETLPLSRYADGEGLNIMLIGQGPGTANGYFVVRYINQDGEERVTDFSGATSNYGLFSNPAGQVLQGLAGVSAGDGGGPYVRLHPGDTGVRAVLSVQLLVPCGGIFAIVLVKEITWLHTKDNSLTPHEVDFMADRGRLPVIEDGAYLNFLGQPSVAGAPSHVAELEFIWS
jgi:hypothetical protein